VCNGQGRVPHWSLLDTHWEPVQCVSVSAHYITLYMLHCPPHGTLRNLHWSSVDCGSCVALGALYLGRILRCKVRMVTWQAKHTYHCSDMHVESLTAHPTQRLIWAAFSLSW
jgi:hypothetical protein